MTVKTARRIVAAGLFVVAPMTAFAAFHTRLTSSFPGADSTVAEMPSEIRLKFSQPVDAKLSTVTLLRADSSLVGKVTMAPVPADSLAIAGPIGHAIDPGSYIVSWRTVSRDGHVVKGKYRFGYGKKEK